MRRARGLAENLGLNFGRIQDDQVGEPGLVQRIANARCWLGEVVAGTVPDIDAIAGREKCSVRIAAVGEQPRDALDHSMAARLDSAVIGISGLVPGERSRRWIGYSSFLNAIPLSRLGWRLGTICGSLVTDHGVGS